MSKKTNRKHHSEAKNNPWTPLVTCNPTGDLAMVFDPIVDGELYRNNLYTVIRRQMTDNFIHLSIRRNDREIATDWRDFQRIKNELAGPEWEAVELYPAESRLVDTSNQYHLWCINSKFPFGWDQRCVSDRYAIAGTRQRRIPLDWQESSPEDILKVLSDVQDARATARG